MAAPGVEADTTQNSTVCSNEATIQGIAEGQDIAVNVSPQGQVMKQPSEGNEDDLKPVAAVDPKPALCPLSCIKQCLATRRRRIFCAVSSCCVFSLALAVAVAVPLLLPRDPDFTLTRLEIADQELLNDLIIAMQPGGLAMFANTSLPSLHLMAEVDLYNPNRMGGSSQGDFVVYFQGNELGTGIAFPADVKPQAHNTIKANATISIDLQLAQSLLDHLLEYNFTLTIQVTGSANVKTIGGYVLRCTLECTIFSDASQLLGPTPEQTIVDKQCKYVYHI
jgi:hypothetical protein